MKDWDLPLLNEGQTAKALDISSDHLLKVLRFRENYVDFQLIHRIAELRKSCGIEPKLSSTITVRRPQRYTGKNG